MQQESFMKVKALFLNLFLIAGILIISPAASAQFDNDISAKEKAGFKPGSKETFQALLAFLEINAATKFTDYDKRTQKEFEGDIANYIFYAKDYDQKFKKLVKNIDTYTEVDLANFILELSNDFQVVEAVLAEFKRTRRKNPNKVMNKVLDNFVEMFVFIVKTLEVTIQDDRFVAGLRDRLNAVESEVAILQKK